MVAVVFPFQRFAGLAVSHAVLVGEGTDFRLHLREDLFLGDAADGREFVIHGDDVQVVELAKNRQLAELADARKEDEAENAAQVLEGAEEFPHLVLERELEFRIFHGVQERRVVFVH